MVQPFQPITDHLFSGIRKELEGRIQEALQNSKTNAGKWEATVEKARTDLSIWGASGRTQNYTPEELAEARLKKEAVTDYEREKRNSLYHQNAGHQAAIAVELMNSSLPERMMDEGKAGRKLSILEISSRLAPVLTFPGSSAYFEVGIVPYGTHAREVLGEDALEQYVSTAGAEGSAAALQQRFGSHYVLAESSAAPRLDVPKSRRNPELYICSLAGNTNSQKMIVNLDFPGVELRAEFDSRVREVMYGRLCAMYGVGE